MDDRSHHLLTTQPHLNPFSTAGTESSSITAGELVVLAVALDVSPAALLAQAAPARAPGPAWHEPADPRAPIFLLSYARARERVTAPGRDRDTRVRELFHDLCAHVNELAGLSPGQDAGFLDATMDGGRRWSDEHAFALNHCQVFVALISPHYLSSPWCAREWHAFERRRVGQRGTAAPADPLIPVNWSIGRQDFEPVIRRPMFTPERMPPDVSRSYRDEGLYGLVNLGMTGRAAYDAVVWRLAQRIVTAARTSYVEPWPDLDFQDLPDSFQ